MEEFVMIQDMTEEYFGKNPDSDNYSIKISLLPSVFKCGNNKAYEIAEGLVNEYPDIIRREIGKIVVLKVPFYQYLEARNKEEEARSQADEAITRYKDVFDRVQKTNEEKKHIEEQISKVEALGDQLNKVIEPLREKLASLNSGLEGLNWEKENLPQEIEEKSNKIKAMRAEIDSKNQGINRELEKASRELKEADERYEKTIADSEQKYKLIDKKKHMTTEEILNERLSEMKAKIKKYKEREEEQKESIGDYFLDYAKGIGIIMALVSIPILVLYGLWYYLRGFGFWMWGLWGIFLVIYAWFLSREG